VEVLLSNIELLAALTARFKHGMVYAGPAFQWADPEIAACTSTETDDICATGKFIGGRLGLVINTVDDPFFPENGILWDNEAVFMSEFNDDLRFARFNTALTGYYTFLAGIPFTLAGRIGAGTNMGEFPFYQAQTLGGGTGYYRGGTLRGFVRDRFRGTSMAYQNIELRAHLFSIPAYQSSILVGVSLHADNGRVWSSEEDGSKWHNAFGAGIFIHPQGMSSFTVTYTSSEERNLVTAGLGFFF
jgi:outer membrane protein assembly factor BamA